MAANVKFRGVTLKNSPAFESAQTEKVYIARALTAKDRKAFATALNEGRTYGEAVRHGVKKTISKAVGE